MSDDNSEQHLIIDRTLEATPDQIWRMWTKPELFAAWYGPAGANITVITMDVRVGGARRLRMDVATPDGTRQMWFAGEYLEVVDNQLLVYTDAMSDENGHVLAPEQTGMPAGHPTTTEVRVELEADGRETRMRLTHLGIPAGSPGAAGWGMALNKLSAHLRDQDAAAG